MSRHNETVTLRITLRYRNLDEFVVRYAENVSSAGLFIRTRAPKPAGTRVRFELLLADGERALRGEGVVVTARNDDKPGMSLRFQALEPGSERLVDRIVEAHGQGKLAPTPLSTSFEGDKDQRRRSFQTSWGSGMRGTSGGSAGWRTPPGAGGWVPLGGRGALGSRGGTPTTSGLLPRRPSAAFGPASPSLPPPAKPNPPANSAPPTLPRRRSSDPRPWATGDLPPPAVPPPVAPDADVTDPETEPPVQTQLSEPSSTVAAAEGASGAETLVEADPARETHLEPDPGAIEPAESSLDASLPVAEAEAEAAASQDETREPAVLAVGTDSIEPLDSDDIEDAPPTDGAEPMRAEAEPVLPGTEPEETEPMQAEAETREAEPRRPEAEPGEVEQAEPKQAEAETREDDEAEPKQPQAEPGEAEDAESVRAEAPPPPEAASMEARLAAPIDPAGEDGGPAAPPEPERPEMARATAAPEDAVSAAPVGEAVSVDRAVADETVEPAPTEGELQGDPTAAAAGQGEAEAEHEIARGMDEVGEARAGVDDAASVEGIEAKKPNEDERPIDAESAEVDDGGQPVLVRGAPEEAAPSSDEARAHPEPTPIGAAEDEDHEPRAEDERDDTEPAVEPALAPSPDDQGRQELRAEDERDDTEPAVEPTLAPSPDDQGRHERRAEDERDDTEPAVEPTLAPSPDDQGRQERRAEGERDDPEPAVEPTLAPSPDDQGRHERRAEDERDDPEPAVEPTLAPSPDDRGRQELRAEDERDDPERPASVEGVTEAAAASTDLPDADAAPAIEGAEIPLDSGDDEGSPVPVAAPGGHQIDPVGPVDDEAPGIEEGAEAPRIDAATEDDAGRAAELGPAEASTPEVRDTDPDANKEQRRAASPPTAIESDPSGPDATQPSNGAPALDADPAEPPEEARALASSLPSDEERGEGAEVEPALHAHGEPIEVPDSGSEAPGGMPPMASADQAQVEDDPIDLRQVVPPSLLDSETGAPARETTAARTQRSSPPLSGQVEVRGLTAEQAAQISTGDRTVVRLSMSAGGARADSSSRGAQRSAARVDPETALAERARPAGPRRPLGLDLGLHYARLGYLESGELKLIPLRGSPYLAAWVAATSDGQLVVGSEASAIARRHPERAIAPLALLEALPAAGEEAAASSIALTEGDSDRIMVDLGDRRFDVADVLLAFLQVIRAAYVEYFGHDHVRLMVSVPAKFDDLSAGFLRSACREAEIESFRLEPEPDALLRAYHLSDQAVDIAMTVDVGLSRLRVALTRRGTAGLRVIAFTEDAGGSARRLDEKIAALALDALREATGEDYRGDDEVRASTISAVEIARPELRRAAHLDLKVEVPTRGAEEDEIPFRRIRISRAQIEEQTDEIVADMCRVVQGLLRNEGIGPHEVGAVVLAGSAGGFPPLVESIGHLVGREPLISVPPVQALLLGLARGGAVLEKKEVVAQPNALASSVGLELPGGRFRPLVHAGTPLPARLARQFPTTRENQTEIVFHLHQGDAEVVRLCTPLGDLRLTGLPKRPRGALTAALTLEIDVDGVVKATLREDESKTVGRLEVATQQTPPARRRAVASKPAEAEAPSSPKKGFFRKLFGG